MKLEVNSAYFRTHPHGTHTNPPFPPHLRVMKGDAHANHWKKSLKIAQSYPGTMQLPKIRVITRGPTV